MRQEKFINPFIDFRFTQLFDTGSNREFQIPFGNRFALLVLIVLHCVWAMGQSVSMQRNDWYELGQKIEPGIEVLGRVPAASPSVDIHVRAMPAKRQNAAVWALAWNVIDGDNYQFARIRTPYVADPLYAGTATLEIGHKGQGEETVDQTHDIEYGTTYTSMRLVYDGFSARLCLKGEKFDVPYFPDVDSQAWLIADNALLCQRLSALHNPPQAVEMAEAANIPDLKTYLLSSTDPAEGVWEFMDRDIANGKATLGGNYVIATIKNADGGYDIAYLAGAQHNAHRWQKMALKGRMRPTIFIGNYDLEWSDAEARWLRQECNAQMSEDKAILTLRFPLSKAQLRFRRIPAAKLNL